MTVYLGAMAAFIERRQKIEAGFIIEVGHRLYEYQSWYMEGVGGMCGYVALDKSDHVAIHQYGDMSGEMRDAKMLLEYRFRAGKKPNPFKPDGWWIQHLTLFCLIAAGIFIFVTFCLPPQ